MSAPARPRRRLAGQFHSVRWRTFYDPDVLAYQLREHFLLLCDGQPPWNLPAEVRVIVQLGPKAAFGAADEPSRVIIRGHEAKGSCDLLTGRLLWSANPPLAPLQAAFSDAKTSFTLDGSKAVITRHCASAAQLDDLVAAAVYVFPSLLNVEFLDPPLVIGVNVNIGGSQTTWSLRRTGGVLEGTTQADLEQEAKQSWQRVEALNRPEYLRLLAALNYFYVGCRLLAAGHAAFEFMAEAILNFAKVLDVLFVSGGQASREQVRMGLTTIGIPKGEIEREYIPLILLRNEFDIAHVALTYPSAEQFDTLHRFTEGAEGSIRDLLRELLRQLDAGTLKLPAHPIRTAMEPNKAEILARIRRESLGKKPELGDT